MPRFWVLSLVLLAGCSTQPCIDVRDYFFPAKLGPNKVQPYGGVCIPQGPVTGPGPALPAVAPIAVPVVPPAAPLPPPTPPPGGVQQQPPGGTFPPPVGPPPPSIFPKS
jgi:hypothetical protein